MCMTIMIDGLDLRSGLRSELAVSKDLTTVPIRDP